MLTVHMCLLLLERSLHHQNKTAQHLANTIIFGARTVGHRGHSPDRDSLPHSLARPSGCVSSGERPEMVWI